MVIDQDNQRHYLPVGNRVTPIKIAQYVDSSIGISGTDIASVSTLGGYSDKTLETEILYPNGTVISLPQTEKRLLEVFVSGAANNIGTFFVKPGSTLADLYQLIDGFRDDAFQQGIVYQKTSLANMEKELAQKAKQDLLDTFISTLSNPNTTTFQLDSGIFNLYLYADSGNFYGRYSGDLTESSELVKNIFVEDGDRLHITYKENLIRVIGEVENSIVTNFKRDHSIKDYIELAGGYKRFADKANAYLIKANGTSKKLDIGFFKSDWNLVSPGDTIVIPRKVGALSGLVLANTAVQTLSNLAFTAASLNSITN